MPANDLSSRVSELNATAVDLDGLLKVLGDNLYSSPSVAIRELIQNAHDGCIRRQIEDSAEFEPEVRLICNPNAQTLAFEDNGSGLTRKEIRDFLATIGTGYTSKLRDCKANEEAIGYFGLGFLSAYVIAETVELTTTSYQSPDETWRFSSSGGRRFTLEQTTAHPVGTRVLLRLKAKHSAFASPIAVSELVAKHCALLPIPILLNGIDQPINDVTLPWNLAADTPTIRKNKVSQDFAETFDNVFSPLCSWDLQSENPDLQGVLWIQDGRSYASADLRSVSIFVRNMLITETCRELLPSWAGFMGCVINTRGLTPTASREDVQRDAAFDTLRESVHSSVLNGLREMPRTQSENWRRVLRRHNEALRGAAIADPQLFELLKTDLQIPTSLGDLTLDRILELSDGKLLIRSDESNTHEAMLFKARGVPVILGYRYATLSFCQAYAEQLGLQVIELGSMAANATLFPKSDLDEAGRCRLAEYLLGPEERLVVSKFEPSNIPFLFVTDEEARLKRKIDADNADERIGAAALSLARLHLKDVEAEKIRDLVVNLNSPFIRQLACADQLNTRRKQAVRAMRAYLLTLSVDVTEDGVDLSAELSNFFDSLTLIFEDN